MKHYLLYVFGLITLSGTAQNYQTFYSTDVHYFREDNQGLMLASQIDSTDFIAGDSLFFPFKSFREGEPEDLVLAPGWMGKKIIVKPDGTNLFFNQNADTIFINTQAGLGDSFTFYTFESGNTVQATVTSITEELVFDVPDSIKTIQLTSEEADFEFELFSFRLGKKTGMMDIFPFYAFPFKYNPIYASGEVDGNYALVGQLYPRKGITKPTHAEMSNFEVGDVMQYERYDQANLYTRRLTILSKEVLDPSTVVYEIERYQNHHFDGISAEFPDFDSLSTMTYTDTFSIADSYVNAELIPEKDYGAEDSDNTFALYYNEPCGYHEYFKSWGSNRMDTVATIFEPHIKTANVHSHGLFKYTTDYHDTGVDIYDHGSYFLSVKHGDLICGTGDFLTLKDTEKKERVQVYPNPSTGRFTVQLEGEFNVHLFSADGRRVHTQINQTNKVWVDANLPNGIYLLVIEQNEQLYKHKLVIHN